MYEASSFAAPTLACDVGGLQAMVQSGVNGQLLHRDSSAEEFAAMIAKLWSDNEA